MILLFDVTLQKCKDQDIPSLFHIFMLFVLFYNHRFQYSICIFSCPINQLQTKDKVGLYGGWDLAITFVLVY